MSEPIATFTITLPSYFTERTRKAVLYADHLASHAYDEAKERALFEAYVSSLQPMVPDKYFVHFVCGEYAREDVQEPWLVWVACAKSRAKAAGC
jgi:hypothetical protein